MRTKRTARAHAARNIFTPGATPLWTAFSRPGPLWGHSRRVGPLHAGVLAACIKEKQANLNAEKKGF